MMWSTLYVYCLCVFVLVLVVLVAWRNCCAYRVEVVWRLADVGGGRGWFINFWSVENLAGGWIVEARSKWW